MRLVLRKINRSCFLISLDFSGPVIGRVFLVNGVKLVFIDKTKLSTLYRQISNKQFVSSFLWRKWGS